MLPYPILPVRRLTLFARRSVAVAHGSLCRLGVRLPAHCWAASNLSLRPSQPIRQLSGSPPGPRQPPFGAGHKALSTGLWLPLAFRRVAFASWAFLCPLRAWAVLPKIVRLTGPGARPHRGYHVPHWSRRERGGCPLYPGVQVSQRSAWNGQTACGQDQKVLPLTQPCRISRSSKLP